MAKRKTTPEPEVVSIPASALAPGDNIVGFGTIVSADRRHDRDVVEVRRTAWETPLEIPAMLHVAVLR